MKPIEYQKVYVLEIEGEFGQMEIDSIYHLKSQAEFMVKEYDLDEDSYRITERFVY